ncbi:alpha/beta fold hydrolase [Gammaproteobacteria bacterium AS21]
MNIHVEKNVNDKPNLVLLHGWASSSKIWRDWLPQLSDHFSLTLIDIPGLGQSTLSEKYSIDAIVDAVLAVLPQKCALLGWSLGGVIATLLAQKMLAQNVSATEDDSAAQFKRHELTALITIASNPCFVAQSDWVTAMPAFMFEQFQTNLINDEQKALARFFLLQVQKGSVSKEILKTIKAVARDESPADLQHSLSLLSIDTRSILATLNIPSYHVFGEFDQLVPAAITVELEKLSPFISTKIINGAGHLPFLSDAEQVANDVCGFLTKQTLGARKLNCHN